MKVLKDQISRLYYTHGLFCASHPLVILIAVCCVILVTCYPLLNVPLPGNAPLEHSTYRGNYSVPSRVYTTPVNGDDEDLKRPRWYVGAPVGYVQQIVVKATVSPWQPHQMLGVDGIRAPLAKVFDILKLLEDFQHQTRDGIETLEDECLRIEEPTVPGSIKSLLPQYSCFVISPANLWHKDFKRYSKDGDIIETIFSQYGQSMQTPPSFKDLLFGVSWKDSGITRYFFRKDQRVISYAVTVVLKKYDQKFIDALRQKLESAFPETTYNVNNSEITSLVHVHYKDFNYIVEYTPLFVTYFVLLLYIYFSVRKIEMVKSQFGLAVSAVVTVVSSLLMSLSLCYFFGLNPTLNGSEIFPYLVMIIGLENVLVITKSVVSTPVHLDVKIRVAQGLSKEGWFITKNLCTELLIIFIGFFTFVPAIQEFCLFALVGLCTDFFLQMFFFATILSVDIRRMELADLNRQRVQTPTLQPSDDAGSHLAFVTPLVSCPFKSRPLALPPTPPSSSSASSPPAPSHSRTPSIGENWQPAPKMYRSLSAPKLDLMFPAAQDDFFDKMPRRLKFFYFWARTRMFQRLIMVCTVIWIGLIFYKTGLVEHIATNLEEASSSSSSPLSSHSSWSPADPALTPDHHERGVEEASLGRWWSSFSWWNGEEGSNSGLLEHTQLEGWRRLSHKFWPRLFALYNISLPGRYVSILPSIHLSANVNPESVVKQRHSTEQDQVKVRVHQSGSLGQSQPQSHQSGKVPHSDEHEKNVWSEAMPPLMRKAFNPQSTKETIITVLFVILSVIVITYFAIWLFKCMCPRNYSRSKHWWWRSASRRQRKTGNYKQIKETLPVSLRGHSQEVECMAVDGQFVISSCLSGQLRIFDSNTGDCVQTIPRQSITPPRRRRPAMGRNIDDSDADLYAEFHGGKMTPESTSSSEGSYISISRSLERRAERNKLAVERLHSDFVCGVASTINTDFNSISPQQDYSASPSRGFDFQSWWKAAENEDFSSARETTPPGHEHGAGDGSYTLPPIDDQYLCSYSQGDGPTAPAIGDQMTEDPEMKLACSIWCLTARDGLIIAGCGNGRIEMWQAETGKLKYQYSNFSSAVNALCFVNNMVVAGRMDGSLEFLELETFQNPSALPQTSHSMRAHRGHARQYSLGNVRPQRLWEDTIRCHSLAALRAHQCPIHCLMSEGDRIVTASDDHTLKVFRLKDQLCLYTLYGHEAGIRALCIDRFPPYAAASGSMDGAVRLWNLMNGTCTHKLKWHEGGVLQLATSIQFVVSLGQDDNLCVWERARGQLQHKIIMEALGGSIMLMSNNLGILGFQGKLELWDLARGEQVRSIALPEVEQAFVRNIQPVGTNSLACTAGCLLSVIRFPTTFEKAE